MSPTPRSSSATNPPPAPLLPRPRRPHRRRTPEQALRDFYNAASHHFPHHRRMWLLLSSSGRESYDFHSFGEFSAYWKKRLAQLRKGKGGSTAPLAFEIDAFKSEKSAGQTRV